MHDKQKILITGKDSYIGTAFDAWMAQFNGYSVETIDLRTDEWKSVSFHGYQSIFHVAGIAHADVQKVSEQEKQLYYQVNRDLAIETAKKAKAEGVRQFIYMSSIIVYGESAPINRRKVISRDTRPNPQNFYGDSKLQAEKGLLKLSNDSFHVVILRPPMIYGKGSKGNYPLLSAIAKKLFIFPAIKNQRSMLHIDNLCQFIKLMIDHEEKGIFFPQNKEYVNTTALVRCIAAVSGKPMRLVRLFNPVVYLLGRSNGRVGKLVNKAFGNIVYDKKLSIYKKGNYQIRDFKESVRRTEV